MVGRDAMGEDTLFSLCCPEGRVRIRHQCQCWFWAILKKHPRLSPGTPLREEGKLLAGEGMAGMDDRENKLPIRVMERS